MPSDYSRLMCWLVVYTLAFAAIYTAPETFVTLEIHGIGILQRVYSRIMKAVLGLLMVTAFAAAPGRATVLFGAYGSGSAAVQGNDNPFLLTQPLPKTGVGVVWVQAVQGGDIVVEVEGQPYCDNAPNLKPQHVYDMQVQLWLLRSNGTALAPHGTPTHVAVSNMGCSANPMQFSFTPVPNEDPIAVVLCVDGKLSVTALPGKAGGSAVQDAEKMKAVVLKVAGHEPELFLVGVDQHANSVSGSFQFRNEAVIAGILTHLSVTLDSYGSEAEAERGREISTVGTEMAPTGKDTFDGLPLTEWNGSGSSRILCRLGSTVINVMVSKAGDMPLVRRVLEGVVRDLR
jgi:hypothetical protein